MTYPSIPVVRSTLKKSYILRLIARVNLKSEEYFSKVKSKSQKRRVNFYSEEYFSKSEEYFSKSEEYFSKVESISQK
ncbi:hypothetical protein J1TS3_29970 [Siminovitchia fordii]|uniref:Uncharacterized protein n=1 Tax=Siminovitchia fordii TaxID=254759 RepID=A0ABQ4K7Z8_9BACI|nr:hypothetical protein J1TS3_29970 [Siminovitchia fordii]